MNAKARWFLVALSTPLVIVAAVGGLIGASPATPQKGFEHLRVFEDVVSLVNGAYVEDVDPDKIFAGAMRGLVEGLDASSAYLPPAEVALIDNKTPLADGDTGLMITRQFYLRVLGVRDGSPAAKAGIRSGDFIRAIDETPTRDMSAFTGTRLLRGAVGSKVRVLIIRGNAAEPHEVTLTREKASAVAVTGEVKSSDKVGVVRVQTFAATGTGGVAASLRSQAEMMQKAGAKAMVIDIRGVADGSYEEAIKAAEVFVGAGVIASRAGRDAAVKETITSTSGAAAVKIPVVILQDFGTAGPAEVFAAALGGNKRAEIVGERSAGLAAEQRLVRLPENFGLWMTYRRYYNIPKTGETAQPILEHGVQPDVIVEEPNVEFGEAAPAVDEMLAKAIERAKAM
ncbi:MAG: PDZ domain-containing protein [Acidobacteria bacterium]|nr:MAG: PDZ domain-containing protein [Acidobacteriota bacterium]